MVITVLNKPLIFYFLIRSLDTKNASIRLITSKHVRTMKPLFQPLKHQSTPCPQSQWIVDTH